MTRSYSKKVTGKSIVTQRTCLNCQKMFKSSGPGNRICLKCVAGSKSTRLDNVYQVIADNRYITESQY